MFSKWVQVAITLSVFTSTWERNLETGQIKGIENILRTADNAKYDDGQDDKNRDDDQSNEIIGIEPLDSYLNRLASNDNKDEFHNDNQDRLDNNNQNRFNNNKQDRINNNDQDLFFDVNLDRLFNDNEDRFSNDNLNRFNNNKRNRMNNKNQDRLFYDNLDRLFDDNEDRFNHDNQDRFNHDNQDRFNHDNQDRFNNDNLNRLNNNKRNRINNNHQDWLFNDNLDRLFDDNEGRFSDDKDRLNNDNRDRLNNNNQGRLVDNNLDKLFNDNQDLDDDDDQNQFDNDNRDRININNQDRLFDDDRFNDDDFENFLRKKSEDLCQKTGRCGCRPGAERCGELASDQKTVDDVRNILDALEVKLNRESRLYELANRDANEENTLNARSVIKLADLMRDVSKVAHNNRNNARVDRILSDNHVDLVVINDLTDIDEVLRQSGFLKSDDLDDITNGDFVDLTRYAAKPRNNGKAMILNLGKIYNESRNKNNKLTLERASSVFHSGEQMDPHDFFNLFGKLKEKVTRDLVKYVISKKAKKPNLNIMNFNQKKRIRILKGEMRRNVGRKTRSQVRSEVEDILFGHGGRIKIVPSDDTDNQVMIPNWMYRIVKDENTKLSRSQKKKRMLPLTNKQKTKLITKNKSLPLIGRFWRRNFKQNSQKYGLPFQLSLQGLAQYND